MSIRSKVSKQDRREINRLNGAKGRGCKTAAGLAVSSQNARKHGMTARTLPLPHGDPEILQKTIRDFADEFGPDTPREHELVETLARASVRNDRCEQYQTEIIGDQIRNAQTDLDRAVEQQVEHFKELFPNEAARAVAGLRQSSLGCSWLMGRWRELGEVLQRDRVFAQAHYYDMARLEGHDPAVGEHNDPSLFDLVMHAERMNPQRDDGSNPWLQRWRRGVPVEMQHRLRLRWKDPADNLAWFQARIDIAVAELEARAEMLRTGREAVERSVAESKALMIADDKVASLWLRYKKEASSEFYRALGELRTARAHRAEKDEGKAEAVCDESSRNEANHAAGGATAHSSRNESSCRAVPAPGPMKMGRADPTLDVAVTTG